MFAIDELYQALASQKKDKKYRVLKGAKDDIAAIKVCQRYKYRLKCQVSCHVVLCLAINMSHLF